MIDRQYMLNSLIEIYNDLIEKEDYGSTIDKLDSIKINTIINLLLYTVKEYTEDDRKIIEIILNILQIIYNNSGLESPVKDDEYDKLYEINTELNGVNVGASFNASNKLISSHLYPELRGTIQKVHFIHKSEKSKKESRKAFEDWKDSIERIVGRKLLDNEKELILTPKWDGVSVIFECENGMSKKALTRGDVLKNEAIELPFLTFNALDFNYVNDKGFKKFGVKTEVIMTQKSFESFKEKYGNFNTPRSAVSSIINSLDITVDKLKYITIIPLQVQDYETKEIIIPDFIFNQYGISVKDWDDSHIKEVFYRIKNIMDKETVPTDGVVIRLKNKSIQHIVGRENNINKFEVAFKFPPEQKRTILKHVEMCTGVLGAITPRAHIEPVKIRGNNISHVSLGSVDRFESLHLRQGDEVIIKYEIIPYLSKDDTCQDGSGDFFETPTQCEYCKEPLEKDPILKCVNHDCDSRKIGKIMNYVEKLSIANISEGIITTLFNLKILKSIEDLYRLENHRREILSLNGFGEKKLENILQGINSRRNLFDYQLLGAIGIPDIGEKIFNKILNIYYIDELKEICQKNQINKLTNIATIKEKTAMKIMEGINRNIGLINFLCSELNITHNDRKYTIKVCFTKVRDNDFEKFLDKKDILVLDSYSKEVDIVITLDKMSDSKKIEKARKDGKEIITLEEAYKLFKYK